MGSTEANQPHVVCIPLPAQGHINPMLKLAKILHSKGFFITFVITEYNYQRLLGSLGSDALPDLPSFHFDTISDGLPPPENPDVGHDVVTTLKSLHENSLGPFKSVLSKVSTLYSPVTCIVADFIMSFTLSAAEELGIPAIPFWTSGAGSLVCYDHYPNLIQKGLMPLKDQTYLEDGYLDTTIDFIPTMTGIRLKDIPPFVRVVNPGDEFMVGFSQGEIERAKSAPAIIFNTFDDLECDILDVLSLKLPFCYGIGPLSLLENNISDKSLDSIKSNMWVEDPSCLKWLDAKEPLSVIYVNFGSVAVMTPQQLVEFCWGLAKSNNSFLWIIRPDLVIGDSAVLPPEFLAETSNRGLLASWCPQEQVLNHPSIGGFLTHSGWNSTIESISSGVPMICWPFFADQQPNCWWSCNKWMIAMEIDNNVKSDEVSKLVIELMSGERGNEMRKNAIAWKNKAKEACTFPSGSSVINLDKLIHLLQTSPK
ncbi:putative 7-deoxyloganetin glucosyltransferase [Helianthus annuus]|uniref:Glycosyltransferase n=1 Tax=Helianthus annuus TaxID=4232 RepID=A0A251UTH8_HELAN|nr:7-deoxyloganetin glucosyltransferase [Helianthus annuus]KAF5807630.1 putative 7-deoxyloganetin glucosyltransferase [Helianthus annuus]